MRLFLKSMDLFQFADGSAVSPEESASVEVRRKFNSQAKKAWICICLAVEPELSFSFSISSFTFFAEPVVGRNHYKPE